MWLDPWAGKILWRKTWQHTPVFFLENPMDRGGQRAAVYGVTKSRTRLKQLSTTQHTGLNYLFWVINVRIKKPNSYKIYELMPALISNLHSYHILSCSLSQLAIWLFLKFIMSFPASELKHFPLYPRNVLSLFSRGWILCSISLR